MDKKITVLKRAEARIVEKKSEFIGNIAPVTCEEEARAFIEEIKKKYYDARHNVFSYILDGGNVSRFTDDGEPKGSAGIPVLNVLKMSGATDMCVVVTRYFGGILLGTGGLVRAYSSAAKAVLDEAGFALVEKYALAEIRCTYTDYQKLQSQIAKVGAVEECSEYTSDVIMRVSLKKSDVEALEYLVTQVTSAKSSVSVSGEVERLVPLEPNE